MKCVFVVFGEMGLEMKQNQAYSLAVKVHEQMGTTKRGYIQAYRGWFRRILLLWLLFVAFSSMWIFQGMDAENKERRKEVLISMCDQRARMLQDQFNVSVNHVHALAILVSTFHYYKTPSAIDQVCALLLSLLSSICFVLSF